MRTSRRRGVGAGTVAVAALLAAVAVVVPGGSERVATDWQQAAADYPWSFPSDHWAHPDYRIEWWYFTGHLDSVDDPDREFGYQFTLFRVGLEPGDISGTSVWDTNTLLMGHASITDKSTGEHRFSELLYRVIPMLAGFGRHPDPEIAWSRAPAGTDGRWSVGWNGEAFDFRMADDARGFSFDLSTRPSKPRVFQGPAGLSRKTREGGAGSLYYSFTRLATTGRLTLGGETWEVRGLSWMDKEFSTSHLGPQQAGWDWFSLQLADGRDLMLYAMRRRDGSIDFACGSVIDPTGQVRYLDSSGWSRKVSGSWVSPKTGIEYPSRWRLSLPSESLDLVLTPSIPNQENVSDLLEGLIYWEGAVGIEDHDGASVGRGYVELTGYGENTRPPI